MKRAWTRTVEEQARKQVNLEESQRDHRRTAPQAFMLCHDHCSNLIRCVRHVPFSSSNSLRAIANIYLEVLWSIGQTEWLRHVPTSSSRTIPSPTRRRIHRRDSLTTFPLLVVGHVPGYSPDCNPLNYFFRGVFKGRTNKHAHNPVDSLKTAILGAFGTLDKNMITRAGDAFCLRPEMAVSTGGDHVWK